MKDFQDELFIVVNSHDIIIDYRTRFDCHHDPSLIHRAIDVLLITSDGKYIIQKRSQQKDLFPGYYCFTATGHVSKGESYEKAAYRELKEEMGVCDTKLKKIDTFITKDQKETEMVCLFIGTCDGKISFAKDEVDSIHYVFKHELTTLNPITPSSFESLKRLHFV